MQRFKNFMLPTAIAVGTIFYKWVGLLSPAMPVLLFAMLFLSFMRIAPSELKLSPLHFIMLAIQLIGSAAIYMALVWWNIPLAEGVMLCIITPAATASAVITGLLGGNVAFLTGYIIVSNIGISVSAPIIFSFIGNNRSLPMIDSMLNIANEIFPILILPLLSAWALAWFAPNVKKHFIKAPLYLWAISLTIVTGKTVEYIAGIDSHLYDELIIISLVTMIVCIGQFVVGRKLGRRYCGDAISAGQGLGQKNTVLAIWMSHTYLSPMACIAPSSYILWQNIINSWQLWRKSNQASK